MGFVVLSDTDFTYVLSIQNSIFIGPAATLYSTTVETTPIISSTLPGRTVRVEGTVLGQNATAMTLTQGDHTIVIGVDGAVYSNRNWVDIVVDGANNLVQNFGLISGGAGIWGTGWGSGRIENDGIIAAQRIAAVKLIDGIGTNTIINDGLITGTGGIVLEGATATIVNGLDGEIRSNTAAAAAIDGSLASTGFVLRNTGMVTGLDDAFIGSVNGDRVRNDGRIQGDVLLGSGNDAYLGRFGHLDGEVRGGLGNDTMLAGTEDDSLFGEGGADRLDGGGGDDTLTGGTGIDTFVFNRLNRYGSDVVTDFQNGIDRLDLTVFRFVDAAAVLARASDVVGGMALDLASVGGGTVILTGMTKVQFDATDMLL